MPGKGEPGEAIAASFLEENGIKILQRNFRSRTGEIDIIALDGETIVFIEVKSYSSLGIESLEYAVDAKKQRKIIETSKYFLSFHREYKYMAIRYDVIFISPDGINHLASAFTEGV
ncbi:MAG: YraN family protein [Treponema sp.]|nr:YraN family protein [Treponema sp.]